MLDFIYPRMIILSEVSNVDFCRTAECALASESAISPTIMDWRRRDAVKFRWGLLYNCHKLRSLASEDHLKTLSGTSLSNAGVVEVIYRRCFEIEIQQRGFDKKR